MFEVKGVSMVFSLIQVFLSVKGEPDRILHQSQYPFPPRTLRFLMFDQKSLWWNQAKLIKLLHSVLVWQLSSSTVTSSTAISPWLPSKVTPSKINWKYTLQVTSYPGCQRGFFIIFCEMWAAKPRMRATISHDVEARCNLQIKTLWHPGYVEVNKDFQCPKMDEIIQNILSYL